MAFMPENALPSLAAAVAMGGGRDGIISQKMCWSYIDTHVLVNDPTTGYGIFIENMLDAAA